jgi:hypothetical protein
LLNAMHIGDCYRDFPLRPACCRYPLVSRPRHGLVLHYAAIDKAETALTADDMLVHHAHTRSERNAVETYLRTGSWTDPVHSVLSAFEKLGVWET